MAVFDERGETFERKFAHDEEMKFKVQARRNRLLGEWAAGKLGVDIEKYTPEVVSADLAEAGDEDVISKIVSDFTSANIKIEKQTIKDKIAEFETLALQQLESGKK